MKFVNIAGVSVVTLALSCLSFAEQKQLIQVKGKVDALSEIEGLLFSPCDEEGRPFAPPVTVPVDADGKFSAALEAGRYRIGSNPPCATVRDMEIEQSGGEISVPEGAHPKEGDADPGTYTGRSFFEFNYNSHTGLSLNFGFNRLTTGVETRNLNTKVSLVGFLSKYLTGFNAQNKISGAGGIKLISDLCENETLQVNR